MNIYESIIFIILLGIYIFKDFRHEKRVDKLLNRVMSRTYQEFQYYEKKWPIDIKEEEKLREESRKSIKETPETVKVDLSEFEEDWSEDEK